MRNTKKNENSPLASHDLNQRAHAHTGLKSHKLIRPPSTIEEQNELGEMMVAWSHLDESFDIEAYPLSLMISPPKFFKIAKSNEYFADCLDFTRYMLYIRRSERCSSKEYDNTWLIKSMALYHEGYADFLLNRTAVVSKSLAAGKAEGKVEYKLCHCLQWPTSDLVKDKPVERECKADA